MQKPVHYVADLKDLREQFEKFPKEMRRPNVCLSDSYTDEEVFDMEIQGMCSYLEDRRTAMALLNHYTQSFIDNFETDLEDEPELLKHSISLAVDYAWCLKRLGEYLLNFFVENQLYDENYQLIGHCHGVVQGRWLVIRRTFLVQ